MGDGTYISMMTDSLRKKKEIMSEVYGITREQNEILREGDVDQDYFSELIAKKGKYIERLEELDRGFDKLYSKVEQVLLSDKDTYEPDIRIMKELIKEITDYSSSIQALEAKNNDLFKKYAIEERARLKKLNASQQTAMTYAQNMAGAHKPGNSYFVNETK